MRIYVDKLPKRCLQCGFCCKDDLGYWCQAREDVEAVFIADEMCNETRLQSCPLLSLSDYTKQVRKEVLGELMNMLGDRAELIDCGGVAEFMFTTYDLSMCVEEILGEEKGESSEQ